MASDCHAARPLATVAITAGGAGGGSPATARARDEEVRMVTRRSVIAALGAGALLTATAACGSGDGSTGGSGDQGPITVLVLANAQYPDQQKQWFADTAAAFEERTGASVKFQTFASAADEQKIIQTSVVSGQGPDVYALGTTFTPVAYATKAFVTLGEKEWEAVGGRDRFTPATLAMSGPSKSEDLGVPYLSRPFAMAYNTEMFAAAGITAPPTTWDELVADGKKLTGDGRWGAAVAYADTFDPWKFVWMFANQYGNPLVEGKTASIDDPAVLRAYQAYFGFLTKDQIVDPESVGWSNAQALASFAAGQSAIMLMTGPTAIPTLESSAVKGKYAFAPMPTVPPGESSLPAGGKPATTIVSGDNIAIADYSDHKDLAYAFVELVTGQEQQVAYTRLFGDLPTNAAAAKEIADGSQVLGPILEAGAGAVPTPFTGAWSEAQLALTNVAVQSRPDLAAGSVPPEVLEGRLAEAERSAQQALDRASDR